jgi:hypothetical protein
MGRQSVRRSACPIAKNLRSWSTCLQVRELAFSEPKRLRNPIDACRSSTRSCPTSSRKAASTRGGVEERRFPDQSRGQDQLQLSVIPRTVTNRPFMLPSPQPSLGERGDPRRRFMTVASIPNRAPRIPTGCFGQYPPLGSATPAFGDPGGAVPAPRTRYPDVRGSRRPL